MLYLQLSPTFGVGKVFETGFLKKVVGYFLTSDSVLGGRWSVVVDACT